MQKKYKILHVISGLERGGAETILVDLLSQLRNNHYEHHVVYFHSGPYEDVLRQQGHPIYKIDGAISLYDPIFLVRLCKVIIQIKPMMIHSHLWAANLLSRVFGQFFGIPVICTLHSPFVSSDGALRKWLDYYTMSRARYICAVSDSVKESWSMEFQFPKNKLLTITNGITMQSLLDLSKPYELKKTYGIPSDRYVIGSVGRYIPSKRFDLLIESFSLLPALEPIHLLLIGGGQEEKNLRQLVRKFKLEGQVTFIVGQEAKKWYAVMDFFVMTSDREGLSIALLEAMAASLPVIVSSSSIRHEVIDNRINGLLVTDSTAQALALAIQETISNKEKAYSYGKNARLTVEKKFSSRIMAEKYEKLYQQIM
jgi:L-malate glycosyltransferase